MSILIVDSYIDIIKRFKDFINEYDNSCIIYTAVNYDEAIAFLHYKDLEYVIMDINLPQNKSYELLKQLKSGNKNIQVIVLSIHVDSYTRNQCKKYGVDYFLDKYHEFDKIPDVLNLKKDEVKTI